MLAYWKESYDIPRQHIKKQSYHFTDKSSYSQSYGFSSSLDYTPPAPLSMGFSKQEYWSGLPFPSPGDLPDPGIRSTCLMYPSLAGMFFTTNATWEAQYMF